MGSAGRNAGGASEGRAQPAGVLGQPSDTSPSAPRTAPPPLSLQWALRDILLRDHMGYQNRTKWRVLQQKVRNRLNNQGLTDSTIRMANEALRESREPGLLIGSDFEGVWVCENMTEASHAAGFLFKKGNDLNAKAQHLIDDAHAAFGSQLNLI